MICSTERLRTLLDAVCEELATQEQLDELAGYVTSCPEAKRFYLQTMAMHADIIAQFAIGADLSPARVPRSAPTAFPVVGRRAIRGWRWVTHPTPQSLIVAGLFLGAVLLSMALWTLPAFSRSQTVAEVIFSRSARWAGAAPAELSLDQPLELLQGTVALRFRSGAVAVVEGPATFRAKGPNGLQLQRGKLAARVPPPAVGFLVSTPTVEVVDLGTEFSVQADAAETEVQVLTGSVEVRAHGENRPVHRLTAKQAARFGNSSAQGFYIQKQEMNRSVLFNLMAELAPAMADGALTYVDAVVGTNTYNSTTGGTSLGGWTNDGHGPSQFGRNGATVYINSATSSLNPPPLRTTISGLVGNAAYGGLRIYFVGHPNQTGVNAAQYNNGHQWSIDVSLDGGTTWTTYSDEPRAAKLVDNATDLGALRAKQSATGNIRLYQTIAGTVRTNSSGSFDILVRRGGAGTPQSPKTWASRTYYDGIAFNTTPLQMFPESNESTALK